MKIKTETISVELLECNVGQIEGVPQNPRIVNQGKFNILVKSIVDSPEMLSIRELVVYPLQGKYVVICGNQRFSASLEAGLKEVPCKVLPEKTSTKKLREYAIKDNVEVGEDDYDILKSEWDLDEVIGWGMDSFSFEETDPKTPEQLEKYENDSPKYPIIPQYQEKYTMYVVFGKSEMDRTFMKSFFNLEKKKSYKSSFLGETFVLTAEEVQDAIANSLSK